MAEITREQFRKMLQDDGATDFSRPILTQQAAAESGARLKVTTKLPDDLTVGQKLGARPGVPFDTTTGVPFMSRMRTSLQPTPDEEFKALESAYGKGNVRLNYYGNPVVTVTDGGKAKDVLADPIGVDFGDFTSALAQVPEMAGDIAGLLLSRGKGGFQPGVWQAFKTLVTTTAGSEVGGGIKDVAVRGAEGSPLMFGEIAQRRTASGALGLGLGAGVGVFTKGATKLITPFNRQPQLNFDARRAQSYIKDRFGIELPMTPGEITGSTFLQRAEALAAQKPGSSVPLDNLTKERNSKIAELQAIMMGGDVPDEEAAARRAMETLGVKINPMTEEVETAARTARSQAEKELLSGISSSTGIADPINKSELGASIRTRAFEIREQAIGPGSKSAKLYAKVFDDPLTKNKNISGDDLAEDADDLISKLPAKEVTTSEASPLTDEFGRPILRDVKGKQVLREFVPDSVMAKVNALSGLRGQQFRLDELMQMRREVDNDIAAGEAVKGLQTRYLSQIRDSLTKRIETGLDELSPKLKADWKAANDNYAQEVKRFKKAGIAEIFRDPEQPSILSDAALVKRATSGSDAESYYRDYKEFFGAKSPEVQKLRRAIADDVLDKSPLSDVIDGAGFVRRIEALAQDAPEVLKEVFGTSAAKLRESAQVLRQVEKGNLPEDELRKAINSGNLSGVSLLYMMQRQADKDLAYRNEIVKALGDGSLKTDKIKPTEFVEKFAFKAEPSDVQQVLGLLSDRPDVMEDIRRLSFKKILDNATVKTRAGEEVLSGQMIIDSLNNENATKRLRGILGRDTFDDLIQLGVFLRAGEARQGAFAAAGGIAGGQQVAGLVERGELKYLERALKNLVTAELYTAPWARAYFANTKLSQEGSAALVNYVTASTPFLVGLARSYGFEGAKPHAVNIKGSIDRFVQENPSAGQLPSQGARTNAPAANGVTRDQFLKMLRQ